MGSRPAQVEDAQLRAAAGGRSVALLTGLAMLCFAGNSLLCRVALRGGETDPLSFTAIRFGSAAGVLSALARVASPSREHGGGWIPALVLVFYAIPFSLAYVRIDAGLGALLLFGAVQVTMIAWGLVRGERPVPLEWVGIVLALAGLVLLTGPRSGGTSPGGAILMLVAGAGWGVYSLLGRSSRDPLQATAATFVRTVPLLVAMMAVGFVVERPRVAAVGAIAAVASGGVTSGLGYVVWYRALSRLTAVQAASVQLTVPVIAAAAGVLFLGERLTLRLVGAAVLILGGIGLAIYEHTRRAPEDRRPQAPSR